VVRNAWTGPVDFLGRVEARDRLGLPADVPALAFVGRIDRVKGADVLYEALASMGEGAPTAVFIGEGPLRPDLARRAEAAGRDGAFRWPGVVDGAARLLRAFDLVVLPSRTEGTPMVLLEAMAAGVPVVATRVGGIPDVVSPDEALLVPPEDAGALAEAITDVGARPDAASERAGSASARLRAEFGGERWIDRYDSIYAACGVPVGPEEEA